MMSAPHWAWGVAGGAAAGAWYGDSLLEIGIGGLIGSPWGSRTLAYSTRGTFRVGMWASRTGAGMAVRGAAWSAAGFAGTATAAVLGPVAVGYGVSHAIAGKQGTRDFTDFMTLKVSPSDWWDAVTLESMR